MTSARHPAHQGRSAWVIFGAGCVGLAAGQAAGQDLLWVRPLSTPSDDYASAVAADATGRVYICGSTLGNLAQPSAGGSDAFLARYDATGAQLWVRQLGSVQGDEAYGLASDSAGSAYIGGTTHGSLGWPSPVWIPEPFLAKYDASGSLVWIRQFGSFRYDYGFGVAADGAQGAYIAGATGGSLAGPSAGGVDAYLARYDPSGTQLWIRQVGSARDDYAYAVAADSAGNAYIAGATAGDLGGTGAGGWDLFLAKYDPSGARLWVRQLGTPADDIAYGVAVDSEGSALVTGLTNGSLGGPGAGGGDVFLAKYDTSGTPLWVRQFGTTLYDSGRGVAVDYQGSAFVAGRTRGSLAGPSAGGYDAFVAKYDSSGVQVWVRQYGTALDEDASGIAYGIYGNVFVAGLSGPAPPSAGNLDALLLKFGPCYANCDGSTVPPILNVADFICFLNHWAARDPYGDCDGNSLPPYFNVNDFICFQIKYAQGCP